MFMHNGCIMGMERIERALLQTLPDHIYAQRQGSTESELAFLLFLMEVFAHSNIIQIGTDRGHAGGGDTVSGANSARAPQHYCTDHEGN